MQVTGAVHFLEGKKHCLPSCPLFFCYDAVSYSWHLGCTQHMSTVWNLHYQWTACFSPMCVFWLCVWCSKKVSNKTKQVFNSTHLSNEGEKLRFSIFSSITKSAVNRVLHIFLAAAFPTSLLFLLWWKTETRDKEWIQFFGIM